MGRELGVAPEVDPEVNPGRGWFRPGAPNSSLELPAPPGTTRFLSGTPLELPDQGAPGSCLEFLVPPWSCWSQEFQTRTWIPPGAPPSPWISWVSRDIPEFPFSRQFNYMHECFERVFCELKWRKEVRIPNFSLLQVVPSGNNSRWE